MGKRVLFLDDDEIILEAFQFIFTDLGFDVTTANDSAEAIRMALDEDFDAILTDIRMPDLNGAQVTRRILEQKPDARIYLITSYPGDPVVQTAFKAGALGVMKKPFDVAKILDILKDKKS